MGISLLERGRSTLLPISSLNLLSFGFTATAVSPSIVSGLVVAIVTWPSSTKGYLKNHRLPPTSSLDTSKSESAVWRAMSQLTSLSPLYIKP